MFRCNYPLFLIFFFLYSFCYIPPPSHPQPVESKITLKLSMIKKKKRERVWGKRFLFYERKDPIKIHWYEFPSLFLCSAQTHAHMWFKCRLSWPLFGKYHFHFKVWFGFFVEYRLSCTALACTTEGCLQWLQITPVSGSSLLVESWPPRIVRTNIYNVN